MAREPGATLEISVKYYNIVADFLGRREEQRTLRAGNNLRDLLAVLAGESLAFRRLALTAEGQVTGHVRLFHNGQAVLDFDEPLAEGDEVRVFPTIAGG